MLCDSNNLFTGASGQQISGTTATGSTDCIDLGAGNTTRNIAVDTDMDLLITQTAAATGTSPTVTIVIECDDNSSFSSPATVATVCTAQALSTTAAGEVARLRLPSFAYERYIRVKFTQGGTSPVCTYDARLVQNADVRRDYATGFSVQ